MIFTYFESLNGKTSRLKSLMSPQLRTPSLGRTKCQSGQTLFFLSTASKHTLAAALSFIFAEIRFSLEGEFTRLPDYT